jgi:enamine deaminase RidA (YjgF/YER057c/UK114 family)
MSSTGSGNAEYLSPDTLPKNPAFSQAVVVSGPARIVYVGGEDAITASGELVGAGDLRAQTEQVFTNLRAALAAANAELHHVVRWTVYVVQGQSIQAGFEVFQREWGDRPNPPAITAAFVAGLAHPHFLVEMDAIAVVPE